MTNAHIWEILFNGILIALGAWMITQVIKVPLKLHFKRKARERKGLDEDAVVRLKGDHKALFQWWVRVCSWGWGALFGSRDVLLQLFNPDAPAEAYFWPQDIEWFRALHGPLFGAVAASFAGPVHDGVTMALPKLFALVPKAVAKRLGVTTPGGGGAAAQDEEGEGPEAPAEPPPDPDDPEAAVEANPMDEEGEEEEG